MACPNTPGAHSSLHHPRLQHSPKARELLSSLLLLLLHPAPVAVSPVQAPRSSQVSQRPFGVGKGSLAGLDLRECTHPPTIHHTLLTTLVSQRRGQLELRCHHVLGPDPNRLPDDRCHALELFLDGGDQALRFVHTFFCVSHDLGQVSEVEVFGGGNVTVNLGEPPLDGAPSGEENVVGARALELKGDPEGF